jgi:hypothetical protein
LKKLETRLLARAQALAAHVSAVKSLRRPKLIQPLRWCRFFRLGQNRACEKDHRQKEQSPHNTTIMR